MKKGRHRFDVLVIGGGIIGLTCALMLQARGQNVAVLDRKGIAAEASHGNAGALAYSDIMPLASPGIMRKAPGWLLDPLGPLTIRPAYALKIAPWMWHFWRASRRSRLGANMAAQAALMQLSQKLLPSFLQATGTAAMLHTDGNLQVYESQSEFQASLPSWEARAKLGIPFSHLHSPEEIALIQPGIAPRFVAATLTPQWHSFGDPLDYALALGKHFADQGGTIMQADVRAIAPEENGVTVHLHDSNHVDANHCVVGAGAWSHRLTKPLGDNIPLETERGYNTTLPLTSFDLKRQITFGGHGFVVTRLTNGIRIGGAVEFAGLNAPPDYRRSEALLAKAKRFLPALDTQGGQQWMGFRPSLPDSLPVIGPSSASPRIIYAFGHGHLGLTQATGTADLVSALVTGSEPAVDLSAFNPNRF